MRLATRILLGYWYLVILMVITAAGAALGFHHLGSNIGRVLTDNVESVRASTAMIESLERQDSAVLARLLGKDGAGSDLVASEAAFREALARARTNITIDDEAAVIDDIERLFAAFARSRDQLIETSPERPLLAYDEQTFPRFEAVKERVLDLLEMNHQAMVEADRAAQATAARRAVTLAMVVLLALFSLAFLSRALNRALLERLQELAEVAAAIAGGSFDRRAAAERSDELGAVARQLNAVLDRQQQSQALTESRVSMYRELVVALLGSLSEPAAVMGFDGRLLASSLGEAAESQLAGQTLQLPRPDAAEESTVRLERDGGMLHIHLLRGSEDRPLAWLVRPRSNGAGDGTATA
jgi:HAMP domain-containing protein